MTGSAELGLAEGLLPKALQEDADGDGTKEIPCSTRWLWTLTLYMSILAVGVALAMLGPTLAGLAEELQISAAAASGLFSVRALGYLLGATVGGKQLDRSSNPAFLLLVSTAITTAAILMIPRMTSLALVGTAFLMQGGIMGMLDTGGNVLMLTVWRGSKYVNAAVHGFHFLFGLGAFLAPVCVSLSLHLGLQPVQTWTVCGISFLPSCFGLLSLVPTRQPQTSSSEGEEGPLGSIVLFTGAFLFAYVGIEVAFGGYIDLFATQRLLYTEVAAANLNSVYWGALSISRLVATLVTPYVDHLRYIQLHLLLAWLSMLSFQVMCNASADEGGAMRFSDSFFTLLYGFALGPLFPGAMLIAEERLAPKPLDGRGAGFTVACAALGEMLFPLVTGLFFERQGPASFPLVQLAVCSLAGVVFAAGTAMAPATSAKG